MSRVLICDFGGVLTSPLEAGFLAYQEESGVTLEELGRAMARAAEEHGDHPLFELERGEISEAEFRARIEAHLERDFDLARLIELSIKRVEPNAPMIEFVRELRSDGVRTALLTNNVREWESLWRSEAGRRAVRGRRRLCLRRPAQARSGDLHAHPRAPRWVRLARGVRLRGRPGDQLRGGPRGWA